MANESSEFPTLGFLFFSFLFCLADSFFDLSQCLAF
jgi:hypothetical protein